MMQNQRNQNSGTNNLNVDTDESLATLQTRITTLRDQIFSFDLSDKVNILNQIQSDIQDSYKGILNTTLSIDQKFSTVITQMGRGVEFSRGIKLNFTDAADEVIRLGGSQQEALTLQENLISSTQKNLILTGDMGKELYAATKVTGLEAATLLNSFLDSGRSIDDIGDTMYDVVKTARDMGVSAKVVSSSVVANLDKLNRVGFENGVEGLTRMAAKAATLRINMESVIGTAEGLASPEKAVELSAALQRLGVASGDLLDPLRLMDLAQNDVGELQNQLSGLFKQYTYFDEKSQSFQIMPGARRELKAIADELGYDIKEVNRMALAGADLDKKISEISFGNLKIDEDTQEQIANLATLNKETGKYEITTKSGDVQSLQDFISTFEGNEEGLKAYLSEQEEGGTNEEKLVNLAEEQLSSTNKMIAILNTMKQSMGLAVAGTPLGDQMLKTIKDYAFKPQEIVSKIAGPQGTVGEGIRAIKPEDLQEISKSLIKGDYSVIEKFGLGRENLTKILDSLKSDIKESTTIDKQVKESQPKTETKIVTETKKTEEPQINFTPSINFDGLKIPKTEVTTEQINNKVNVPEVNKPETPITPPVQMLTMDETNTNLVTLNETLLSINETILNGDDRTKQIQDLLIEHLPKIDGGIEDFISLYDLNKIDIEQLGESLNQNKENNTTFELNKPKEIKTNEINKDENTLISVLESVDKLNGILVTNNNNLFSGQKNLSFEISKNLEKISENIKIEKPEINFNESFNKLQTKDNENLNVETEISQNTFAESVEKIQTNTLNGLEDINTSLIDYFSRQEQVDLNPLISEIGDITYPTPNVQVSPTEINLNETLNGLAEGITENLSNGIEQLVDINEGILTKEQNPIEINLNEVNSKIDLLKENLSNNVEKISKTQPKEFIIEDKKNEPLNVDTEKQYNLNTDFGDKLINQIASLNIEPTKLIETESVKPIIINEGIGEISNAVQQTANTEPIENSLKEIQNLMDLTINKPINVEPPKLPETKIETVVAKQSNQTENKTEENKKIDINHTITIDVKGNNMDNNVLATALNNPIFKQKLIQSTDLTKNSYVSDYNSVMNIADAKYS